MKQESLTSKESAVSQLHEGELRACVKHLKEEGMGYSADVALRAADEIDRLTLRNAELVKALGTYVQFSKEAHALHDADKDMKVLKLLAAMSGYLPKYRADIDGARAALKGDAT